MQSWHDLHLQTEDSAALVQDSFLKMIYFTSHSISSQKIVKTFKEVLSLREVWESIIDDNKRREHYYELTTQWNISRPGSIIETSPLLWSCQHSSRLNIFKYFTKAFLNVNKNFFDIVEKKMKGQFDVREYHIY